MSPRQNSQSISAQASLQSEHRSIHKSEPTWWFGHEMPKDMHDEGSMGDESEAEGPTLRVHPEETSWVELETMAYGDTSTDNNSRFLSHL